MVNNCAAIESHFVITIILVFFFLEANQYEAKSAESVHNMQAYAKALKQHSKKMSGTCINITQKHSCPLHYYNEITPN